MSVNENTVILNVAKAHNDFIIIIICLNNWFGSGHSKHNLPLSDNEPHS